MSDMSGKIAIVTGGTQGLGAAIARRLAQDGAAGLVLCGRNAARGRESATAVEHETGVRTIFVQADLGHVEACRHVVAEADAQFGRLDTLVNAAAITDR